MAETTATTLWPACFLAISRAATFLIRSGDATEVPPNFATMSDIIQTFFKRQQVRLTIAKKPQIAYRNVMFYALFTVRDVPLREDVGRYVFEGVVLGALLRGRIKLCHCKIVHSSSILEV